MNNEPYIKFYPIPNEKQIIINSSIKSLNYSLIIYDLYGKKVLTHALTNQITKIDISILACGIYFISVLDNKTKKSILTDKFIINF